MSMAAATATDTVSISRHEIGWSSRQALALVADAGHWRCLLPLKTGAEDCRCPLALILQKTDNL